MSPVAIPDNPIHATAVVVRDRGVLILGASGSGKTTLALSLIGQFQVKGLFARLISDDRVSVRICHGRLLGRAPASIRGLVEVHGLGPLPVDVENEAVLDVVVRLVGRDEAPRMREDVFETVLDCRLPRLDLPRGQAHGNVLAIEGWLREKPFSPDPPSA